MGFVIRTVADHSDEPVIRDERPNWVWPVALVDFFGDGLEEYPYMQFLEAMQLAGGADAPAEQRTVLKAMLLQIAGQVTTRRTGYETTIAHLSGLPQQVASEALKSLADSGVVRPDANKRFYTFWPIGGTAHRVEELLQEKLREQVLDRKVLDRVNGLLKDSRLLDALPVSVPWGEDTWGEKKAVDLDEVAGPGAFASLFFMGSGHLDQLLEELRREGIVDLYHNVPPYQVVRLWSDKNSLLQRLYD